MTANDGIRIINWNKVVRGLKLHKTLSKEISAIIKNAMSTIDNKNPHVNVNRKNHQYSDLDALPLN